MKREEEYILLLNIMEKIKRRVSLMKRKDGAYDKTAEDVRRIIAELDVNETKYDW